MWSRSGARSPQRERKGCSPSCVGEGTAILKTRLRENLASGVLIKLLSMPDMTLTTA